MTERYSSFKAGTTSWFLQRVTAAFLIVVLVFHFMSLHFVQHAAEIEFAGSASRMANIGYLSTMILFLVTATFHGVNGVYNALINQGISGYTRQGVKWFLVIASVALIAQGIRLALALRAGGI